jgi:hypothetical protein
MEPTSRRPKKQKDEIIEVKPEIIEAIGEDVEKLLAKGYKLIGKEKRPFEGNLRQFYWVYSFESRE